MATSKDKKLTQEQITMGLHTFAGMFPEDAGQLIKYRETIIDHIHKGTNPPPDSKLVLNVGFPSLTDCEMACGVVVVDVVFFVFGLVGLHISNQERLTRAVLRELGPDTLRGLARAITAFSEAEGATAKATALFTLMGQIYNAGGFGAAFKVAKDEMSWWDWTKTGIIAVAQIIAWFATDGVAFIAEAALQIMSAVTLIEDSVKAAKACS